MSQEYEFDDLTREEAAAVLYRLADGVAVGSVAVGDRTIAVPDRLDVEIEREDVDDERELDVELEWPMSETADGATDPADAGEESDDAGVDEPEGPSADEGGDLDAALVEDTPAEPQAADEPDQVEGVDEAEDASGASGDAPDPTSVVEPGEVAASGSNATFELFRDNAGEWRWRLVHANGNIIADSGEGYSSKANARTGLRSVQTNAPEAEVVGE